MKENLKSYVSLIKKEADKKHKFSVLMHTIQKEEYSTKLQSFYAINENVQTMLDISNNCMFFDNESEDKFLQFMVEKE